MEKFIELIMVESYEDMKSEKNRLRPLISKHNEFNEIPMIKIVRELTQCDLIEAKNLVIAMREDFRSFNKSRRDIISQITDEMYKMDKVRLKHLHNFALDMAQNENKS